MRKLSQSNQILKLADYLSHGVGWVGQDREGQDMTEKDIDPISEGMQDSYIFRGRTGQGRTQEDMQDKQCIGQGKIDKNKGALARQGIGRQDKQGGAGTGLGRRERGDQARAGQDK